MIHHLHHLFPVQQSLLCVVIIKYGEIKSILRAVEHNFKIDGSINQSMIVSNKKTQHTNTHPLNHHQTKITTISDLPTYLPTYPLTYLPTYPLTRERDRGFEQRKVVVILGA